MENHNKLDIAAKLFPSVTNKGNSSVFRVSVILKEEVDAHALQLAVNMIYERFSLFFLRLKKGFFWNYFDTNYVHFTVEKELLSPCDNILTFENKGYIIKVLYYKNRISVEAFHSITDGSGVLEFIKSLVYYYHCVKHGEIDSQGKVLLFNEAKKNDEDSFLEHFSRSQRRKKKTIRRERNSFRIKGKKYAQGGNSVVTATISVNELKKYCKEKKCTITALLIANMITSIYREKQKGTKNKKEIVIAIPVNLRKIFSSQSLKNFFGVINVGYRMDDSVIFESLIQSVHEQLQFAGDQDYLGKASEKNVKISNNFFSRHMPLIFKNLLMPIGFNLMGEIKKTITISNIGKIDLPDGVKPFIEHAELLLYPTKMSPINCGVCSFEDTLSISFTRSIIDSAILKRFITSLMEKTGANITVYSNQWGEKYEKM